jgi:hypothetical protein
MFGLPVSELPTFAVGFLSRTVKYLRYCIFRKPPLIFSIVDLDLDQFGSGSLLVRYGSLCCGSTWCDFQPWSQIGIRVVAKSAGSKNLILHLWMRYSKGRSFKTAYFVNGKKGSRTLV